MEMEGPMKKDLPNARRIELLGILALVLFLTKYKDRLGICLDTCHLNDAGYDLTKFDDVLDEFDNIIGLDKIKCIHINDSKNIIKR